jgi:hypothetical protein
MESHVLKPDESFSALSTALYTSFDESFSGAMIDANAVSTDNARSATSSSSAPNSFYSSVSLVDRQNVSSNSSESDTDSSESDTAHPQSLRNAIDESIL